MQRHPYITIIPHDSLVWDPCTIGIPTNAPVPCKICIMKISNEKTTMKMKSMISVFSRSLQTRKPARELPLVQYPAYNNVCAKYGLLSIDKPISYKNLRLGGINKSKHISVLIGLTSNYMLLL